MIALHFYYVFVPHKGTWLFSSSSELATNNRQIMMTYNDCKNQGQTETDRSFKVTSPLELLRSLSIFPSLTSRGKVEKQQIYKAKFLPPSQHML